MTEISPSAFYNCRNLKDVIISDGVIEISREAFYDCSNLKEVSIPSSVKEIGPWAFNRVKVVNIYNDEGNVIIHPHAFSQNVKINYKRPSLLSRLFKKL